MYLHSLQFTAWVQFPVYVTFLHLEHCPPASSTYIHCMGSIHSMDPHHTHVPIFTVFSSFTAWAQFIVFTVFTSTIYLYSLCSLHSLCGFNSLCGVPTTSIHYVHCMDSIPCVDNLFALTSGLHPPPTNVNCNTWNNNKPKTSNFQPLPNVPPPTKKCPKFTVFALHRPKSTG